MFRSISLSHDILFHKIINDMLLINERRNYFLNPPASPTPRIVNKGKQLAVRLGQPITIPCEIQTY